MEDIASELNEWDLFASQNCILKIIVDSTICPISHHHSVLVYKTFVYLYLRKNIFVYLYLCISTFVY